MAAVRNPETGERMWVPEKKKEIIERLEKWRVKTVAGKPLRQVPKERLFKICYRMSADRLRQKQRTRYLLPQQLAFAF